MINCKLYIIFIIFYVYILRNGESKLGGVLHTDEFHRNPLPYQVLIRYKEKFLCRGIILTENDILTTSSCVRTILNFQNIQIIPETFYSNTSKQREVINIIHHPEYKYETNENDFAVINLNIPFNFTHYAKPANLSKYIPIVGASCTIPTWKFIKQDGKESFAYSFLNASIINQNACNEFYNGSILNGICVKVNSNFEDGFEMKLGNALICDNKLSGFSFLINTYQNTNSVIYTPIANNIKFLHSVAETNMTEFSPRIIGGTNVSSMTETPYQVSLRHMTFHVCGGTILDQNHVLTAAHCIRPEGLPCEFSLYSVMVGSTVLDDDSYVKHVRCAFVHANYDNLTNSNDIALIQIMGYFDFSEIVSPLRLQTEILPEGTKCIVSGWGFTSETAEEAHKHLQFVKIEIINLTMCNYYLEGHVLKGMMCAGKLEGSKDSCKGDSGGPLVCSNRLTGIVSWGPGCGRPNSPGVYTDVHHYLDWINKQLMKAKATAKATDTSYNNCLKSNLLFIQFGLFLIFYCQ